MHRQDRERVDVDPVSLQDTLARSLGHSAAYNQFAQAVLMAATLGQGVVDVDQLVEPLQQLQRGLPEDSGATAADAFEALRGWMEGAGPLPGFEAAEPATAEWIEWQQALAACRARWRRLGESAANEFRQRLGRAADQPMSLMRIYRTWVDAYENSYARALRSAGFLRDHAWLLNAGTRVVAWTRRQGEAYSARYGGPRAEDLDRMVEELHRLRRELRRRGGA